MRKKRTTMEGSERSHPHRSGSSAGGATDFFVCFTARPSSSSATSSTSTAMRLPSSKALMSPSRGRDPSSVPALSSSLSRRLRSSGSVKGGQSPMFPSAVPLAGRKKGCAFEAAEPSSPKVTCIGQVRVKAKKKVKSKARTAMERSRSRSRSKKGRECCPRRNQSWVHQLPLSICEAFKGIGSEFNCFLPCGGRSLCGGCSSNSFSTGDEKVREDARIGRSASSNSCGAMLARWVLAVQESEEEVKRGEKVEVEFLLREREEKVLEADIDELSNRGGEKGQILVVGEKGEVGEDEPGRVSVCIPPRNALLLMRCRSDPVRMAALANRFWGSPGNQPQIEEEKVIEDDEVEEKLQNQGRKQNHVEERDIPFAKREESQEFEVYATGGELIKEENGCKKSTEEEITLVEKKLQVLEEEMATGKEELSCGTPQRLHINPDETEGERQGLDEQENGGVRMKFDRLPEENENVEGKINKGSKVKEECRSGTICASRCKERGKKRSKERDSRRHSFSSELDSRRHSFSSEREARRASFSIDRGSRWSFSLEKSGSEPKDVKSLPFSVAEVRSEGEKKNEVTPIDDDEEEEEEAKARGDSETSTLVNGNANHEPEIEESKKGVAGEWTELPDCLLMMMYEPKLSMEVSKETWVCGNDFLRWRPHHTRNIIPIKPDLAPHTISDNAAAHPPESISNAASAPENTVPVSTPSPLPETPMATTVQHKLSSRPAAVAPYEPLVLTRCKSEPMRSSARLTPDACFWKDRHRPVGAAGIGF